MLVRKCKEKVKKLFKQGKLDEIEVLFPNISDHVMNYADTEIKLDELIDDNIEIETHEDGIKPAVFIYGLISSRLKRIFSISQSIFAITTPSIIEKFQLNIVSKESFTCESNMRKFIDKIGKSEEITEEAINEEIKTRQEKNKERKENNKQSIDSLIFKQELQIKQNGHQLIKFFNKMMKSIIKKIKRPTIHILDCVKIPVNTQNKNYELSTVINYEGKVTRGYKMGVLRAITDFGGLIEHLIDGTIATNDIALVEKDMSEYDGLKKGDYLIMDRGFAKIEFIINLVKRGINVIIPVKKNMDIYKECIKLATSSGDGWEEHPNSKRKGQFIKLITNLKGTWIVEKDKTKKPEKMLENVLDFSASVIRIDKTEKTNKSIIEAAKKGAESEEDTDVVYEDEKYIYIVVVSTNTELTAGQIIRYYEMRPEIEEDFRQLKDIWKCCNFTSTKYVVIMCHIVMTFLAYNLFNMFKTSKKGKKYINKSMVTISHEEQRDKIPFYETKYLIVTNGYYCLLEGIELLDLYADCPSEIRDKIRSLLTL